MLAVSLTSIFTCSPEWMIKDDTNISWGHDFATKPKSFKLLQVFLDTKGLNVWLTVLYDAIFAILLFRSAPPQLNFFLSVI